MSLKRTKLRLTVTFPIEVWYEGEKPPIDGDVFAEAAQWTLTNYCDGRYPFSSETVVHGISLIAGRAVREVLNKANQETYKGETVPYVIDEGASGVAARWYMETEKAMKDINVGVGDMDSVSCTAEIVEEEKPRPG